MERDVGRLDIGLGTDTADSGAIDDDDEGWEKTEVLIEEGRVGEGSFGFCATGERDTASLTGSNAGMLWEKEEGERESSGQSEKAGEYYTNE